MLDQDDHVKIARALGAKPTEIMAVHTVDAGVVATTHDGTHSLIRYDGSVLAPYRGWPGEFGPELIPAMSTTVPAIPLPTVGQIYTAEHEQALLAWLLDQGVAPAIEEPAAATPPVDEEADVDGDTPPGGTVTDVLAWVGEDTQRAVQALAAEQLAEKPRASLVGKLAALAAGGGATA